MAAARFPRAISTRASPSRDGRLIANTVDASRPSVSHAFVCAALKLDSSLIVLALRERNLSFERRDPVRFDAVVAVVT